MLCQYQPNQKKKHNKREGWSQFLFVALKYLQSYSCHLEARLSCTHHNIALICTTVKPNSSNRQIIVKKLVVMVTFSGFHQMHFPATLQLQLLSWWIKSKYCSQSPMLKNWMELMENNQQEWRTSLAYLHTVFAQQIVLCTLFFLYRQLCQAPWACSPWLGAGWCCLQKLHKWKKQSEITLAEPMRKGWLWWGREIEYLHGNWRQRLWQGLIGFNRVMVILPFLTSNRERIFCLCCGNRRMHFSFQLLMSLFIAKICKLGFINCLPEITGTTPI